MNKKCRYVFRCFACDKEKHEPCDRDCAFLRFIRLNDFFHSAWDKLVESCFSSTLGLPKRVIFDYGDGLYILASKVKEKK